MTTALTDAPSAANTPCWSSADARAAETRMRRALEKRAFFIVGCQKSGTTWLQRLFDGHPQIRCHGESCVGTALLPALLQTVKAHNDHQRAGDVGKLAPAQVEWLFSRGVAMVMSNWLAGAGDEVTHIGEKTPEHALAASMLARAIPHAKFIHIIRDPRDGAVSGWFHNLREKGEGFKKRFPTFARYVEFYAANHWIRYIQAARETAAAHPERCVEIRYETLHAHPEQTTRELLEFLGADAQPQALAACLEAGDFKRLSGGRDRGQEDAGSHFRKGVVGDWRERFDPDATRTLERVAGPAMRELGYSP